jgi:Ppx/GppA phosphatase family protein
MKLALAVLLVATAGRTAAAEPAPSSCVVAPDKQVPVTAPGRDVYCGLDLGSRTAKLSVVSMEKRRFATVRDERLCKRTLGMGALVFDSRTRTAGPLPDSAIAALVDTIKEYEQICARDGGEMVAAAATQWARDATNIAEVSARVNAATKVRFDVLSPVQEAEYAYAAGSVGRPGRIVLDAGSNSFELAWQEKGSPAISTILVPYGYVRGAANDFEPAADYAAGWRAYQAKARAAIEQELGRLSPPLSLARLRGLVARGKIGPDVIALGDDGAVIPLAVRGLLRRSATGWVADAKAYDQALGRHRVADSSFGLMTAPPVRPAEIAAYFRGIRPADFTALKADPARGLYGPKALVNPALADLLLRELGGRRLVTVPQESTTGHILTRLRRRGGA